MPLEAFYRTLAQASFTLFGLWIVVLQLRRGEWRATTGGAAGAQMLTMHFALPGVMSLLALADPDGTTLWRISFAVLALLGGLGVALLAGRGGQMPVGHWASLGVYGAIAVVALLVGNGGVAPTASALQVEAVLLSVLILLSLNSVFWLMMDAGEGEPHPDRAQDA